MKRVSGVLLPLTSLPSKHGIGDMGHEAYKFVDWLKQCDQSLWQVLPFGVTDDTGCPYASRSAFGGNFAHISLEKLIDEELLTKEDLARKIFKKDFVDFPKVHQYKEEMLSIAFQNFKTNKLYKKFLESESFWIEDFALFLVLSKSFGGHWNLWPDEFKKQSPLFDKTISSFIKKHKKEIEFEKFKQFIFFKQWHELKYYANNNGVEIIGDIPIFVAHHSMEVWSHPEWFKLKADGSLLVETGAAPDPFSELGQKWGTPNYNWAHMKKDKYMWWVKRLEFMDKNFDFTRLDHFRGFAAVWVSDPLAPDARNGQWDKGPGIHFFETVLKQIKVKLLVEDLGEITPDVHEMRDHFNFPGMKIMQFAFGFGDKNIHLPQNFNENNVVYTGTHDCDTTVGWSKTLTDKSEIDNIKKRLHIKNFEHIQWDLLKFAYNSKASIGLVPLWDIMGLGSDARYNLPGTVSTKNWTWRFEWNQITEHMGTTLKAITIETHRNPKTV